MDARATTTVDPTEVHVIGPATRRSTRVAAARADVADPVVGHRRRPGGRARRRSTASATPCRQVKVDPATAHVRSRSSRTASRRPLPVSPQVTGSPAAGFEIASVDRRATGRHRRGRRRRARRRSRPSTRSRSRSAASRRRRPSSRPGPADRRRVALDVDQRQGHDRHPAVTATRTFEVGVTLVGARPDSRTHVDSTGSSSRSAAPRPTSTGSSARPLAVDLDVTGLASRARPTSRSAPTLPLGARRLQSTASPAPGPSVTVTGVAPTRHAPAG